MAVAAAHRRLTEQQEAAVTRRESSVVLASGAGCGKTHVLTERYLSHLVGNEAAVGEIVAITFTERAAREMRGRIRTAVVERLEAAASDDEVRRWEAHLRDLETAQISTIHAFCTAMLRQYALEAGLDPRFEVLEDYLAANLQTEALAEALQKLLTAQGQAAEDLKELVVLYGWQATVAAVQHLMRDRDQAASAAWLARAPEDIAAAWRQHATQTLLPRYLDYLRVASPGIADCWTLVNTTPCVGPKMRANVDVLLEKLPRLHECADLAGAVDELCEAAKVGSERANAWPSEEDYQRIKAAFENFRDALPKRLAVFCQFPDNLPEIARVGQRFLRVADEAQRAYRQLKSRHDVLDFDDLLVLARNLLRDQPAVRERLGRRWTYFLIDELQDTDTVQMEIVEQLCDAGLTHGKLFAVGDHAQSIYRFRGADVRLFQKLRQQMPEGGRLGLTLNFRSQPGVLDFTNALVGSAPGWRSGLEHYAPLQAKRPQTNPGPCVEFLWTSSEAGEYVAVARQQEAVQIARRIAAMVRGGERLVVEDRGAPVPRLRPVRAQDVVLLFRAMTNIELYEAALKEYDLDYYLVGGRAFFAQQEVYDLLNLLRALENPQDAVSLAGALRSPFCCLSDEALYVLGGHTGGLWAALYDGDAMSRLPRGQRGRAELTRDNLSHWRSLKDRLSIAGLLNRVFADSGYDAATQFEFLAERKLANLWKLVDLARDFDRTALFGLAGFIARLAELVRTQPREEQAATQPENADVVRLMSIHQAKGLEFPVVFLPDIGASGRGGVLPAAHWDRVLGCVVRPPAEPEPPFTVWARQLWKAGEELEEWREELRTLYVGCTRAEDYLVLSASVQAEYRPDGPWLRLLAERFDLRSGHCLVPCPDAERTPKVRVVETVAPPPAVKTASPARPSLPTVLQPLPTAPEPGTAQWHAEDESDWNEWPR
jgi:ATP-dependent helicase/nuclease subunit A